MIIGTRESKLALRQTEMFIDAMRTHGMDSEYVIKGMKSLGDVDQISPLNGLDDIGAFVRELDDALLRKEIDVSVNSMKDIPVMMAPELTIAAILPRDDVRDVCIPCPISELGRRAIVGTSSVRREHIIRSIRPDLKIKPIRGNIHTRLEKLDSREYDAIILAKAGLDRMEIDRDLAVLDRTVFVPAPAQGAIAVECRSDDIETIEMLKKIDDPKTRTEVTAERTIMRMMGAGCSSPVGINAEVSGKDIRINAVSFASTVKPIRIDMTMEIDTMDDRLQEIANILMGKVTLT